MRIFLKKVMQISPIVPVIAIEGIKDVFSLVKALQKAENNIKN